MDHTAEKEIGDLRVAVGRIEERINSLSETNRSNSENVHESLEDIRVNAKAIMDTVDKRLKGYVTKESFRPVEMLTYGFAGAVLMAVLTVALKLVLN